ncbi:hypothetical protein BGP_1439 [Beggiatoa sp. PS]|nr:hypothetical protein BGP_1439 [Beggiatoa sp. PS]
MSTETITLKIPSSLAQELSITSEMFLADIVERGLRDFKIDMALEQYSRGNISFGGAANKANVSQSILARYAYAKGMEPPFSAETVTEELGDILC